MTAKERETLILQWQGLPVHIAKKFCRVFPGWKRHWEDLVQEGQIGLCIAFDKWKPDGGAKPGVYAYLWVEDRVRRCGYRLSKRDKEVRLGSRGAAMHGHSDGDGFDDNSRMPESCIVAPEQHDVAEAGNVVDKVRGKLNEMRSRYGDQAVEILTRRLIAENGLQGKGSRARYKSAGVDLGISQLSAERIGDRMYAEFSRWAKELKDEEEGI